MTVEERYRLEKAAFDEDLRFRKKMNRYTAWIPAATSFLSCGVLLSIAFHLSWVQLAAISSLFSYLTSALYWQNKAVQKCFHILFLQECRKVGQQFQMSDTEAARHLVDEYFS